MSHSANLQTAIYQALVAADLTGVTVITDSPIMKPTDANFPFVEIGNSQAIPADAGGDEGLEEFVDIHVWTRSASTLGQAQAKTIAGEIYDVLHHAVLTVSGRATAYCFLDAQRILGEEDGLTHHAILTFRIHHRS